MDLETLRTFVAVARHGGVLAAARALRVPKQTVSGRLAQLEAEVGLALFEHERRPLLLTEAGRLFAERSAELVGSAEAAMAELRGRGAAETGTVRVASPALFARWFVAPALGAVARRFPLLRFEVAATDSLDPAGPWEFDLVIWIGEAPDVHFRAVPLGRARNVLCAAASLARTLPADPAALASVPVILYTRSPRVPTWRVVRGREIRAVPLSPWLTTNEPEVALSAVLAGQGVASLPWLLAQPHLRSGQLQRVFPAWRMDLGPILALVRTGTPLRAPLDALVSEIRRAVEALPAEDAG